MGFHVEMQTAANVRRGMAPDAARARAEREFGSVVRTREDVRDARGLTPLDDLARDARFAARVLRRDPGFTTVAVLTLALGIGASTAVFSVVDGVLLRPLPFSEPDRLVAVYEAGTDYPHMALSGPNLIDWQAQSRQIESFASYDRDELTVLGGREPVRVPVAVVTGDFFHLLRVSPEVGRTFTADEMRSPTPTVALVGRRFWTTQLAGQAPGTAKLEVYGHVLTVVGVLPESFDFPERAQVWIPGGPIDASASGRTAHNYDTIARLAPGATVVLVLGALSGRPHAAAYARRPGGLRRARRRSVLEAA
jgi:hypothetical protein